MFYTLYFKPRTYLSFDTIEFRIILKLFPIDLNDKYILENIIIETDALWVRALVHIESKRLERERENERERERESL